MTDPIRRRVTLERTWDAPLEDVWELWTTRAGIESWWGPDGFAVTVGSLDLRPGGELTYAMTAVAPEQIAFLQRAGMPLVNQQKLSFTEVVPQRRLAYRSLADFIPGVAAYPVDTQVELHPTSLGVRMVLTFDAMHDDRWTNLAVMGHESQLGRLSTLLAARGAAK